MNPVSPVIPGHENFETVFAKDQPEYLPLPTIQTDKAVLSRWSLTPEEREYIAQGGDLFIIQLNYAQALQPVLPIANNSREALRILIEVVEGG